MENCSDSELNCNRLEFWWLPNCNKTTGPFSDAMTNKFGGKWVVFICKKDEICSYSGVPGELEYLKGWYGQAYWSIARY